MLIVMLASARWFGLRWDKIGERAYDQTFVRVATAAAMFLGSLIWPLSVPLTQAFGAGRTKAESLAEAQKRAAEAERALDKIRRQEGWVK